MTSIGQILADARRQRKVTAKDVEKAIKIRAKYIKALEQDAFDQIVGEAYVVGFLKTYAQWLELDPRPLVDRYREQHGWKAAADEPPASFSRTGTSLWRQALRIVLITIALLLAVFLVAKVLAWGLPLFGIGR